MAISLSDMRKTWLWEDAQRLKRFLDLAFMSDSNDVRFTLGELSKKWLLSKSAVRYFLKQCEDNGILKASNGLIHLSEELLIPPKAKKPPKPIVDKIADMEARRTAFYNALVPFVGQYGREMIRAFYDYWSEANKSNTKMRWEGEPTFEISKRLVTWNNRNKNYARNTSSANERSFNAAVEQRHRINAIGEYDEECGHSDIGEIGSGDIV